MAASLLAENECIIRNVPLIKDVLTMIEVLRSLGAEVSWADHAVLRIVPKKDLGYSAPDELVREMRASVQVMGPLLSRMRKVKLFQPGVRDWAAPH